TALPAERVGDVVTLLPRPAFLAPPGAVLVAAAFCEREEGRVRHRSSLYRKRLVRYTVARSLVVVGEAAVRSAQLELAGGYLDPAGPRRRARQLPVLRAAGQAAEEQ